MFAHHQRLQYNLLENEGHLGRAHLLLEQFGGAHRGPACGAADT